MQNSILTFFICNIRFTHGQSNLMQVALLANRYTPSPSLAYLKTRQLEDIITCLAVTISELLSTCRMPPFSALRTAWRSSSEPRICTCFPVGYLMYTILI